MSTTEYWLVKRLLSTTGLTHWVDPSDSKGNLHILMPSQYHPRFAAITFNAVDCDSPILQHFPCLAKIPTWTIFRTQVYHSNISPVQFQYRQLRWFAGALCESLRLEARSLFYGPPLRSISFPHLCPRQLNKSWTAKQMSNVQTRHLLYIFLHSLIHNFNNPLYVSLRLWLKCFDNGHGLLVCPIQISVLYIQCCHTSIW